jgi:hypothetical protein
LRDAFSKPGQHFNHAGGRSKILFPKKNFLIVFVVQNEKGPFSSLGVDKMSTASIAETSGVTVSIMKGGDGKAQHLRVLSFTFIELGTIFKNINLCVLLILGRKDIPSIEIKLILNKMLS